MSSNLFPNVPATIPFEGPKSKNPLAFKHYNPKEKVEGKTMAEHLRFSVVYWHTMCGAGADMFGMPTALRPWENGLSGLDLAKARVPVFFEITKKLQAPYYAFHDRDIAPHGQTLRESNQHLDTHVRQFGAGKRGRPNPGTIPSPQRRIARELKLSANRRVDDDALCGPLGFRRDSCRSLGCPFHGGSYDEARP